MTEYKLRIPPELSTTERKLPKKQIRKLKGVFGSELKQIEKCAVARATNFEWDRWLIYVEKYGERSLETYHDPIIMEKIIKARRSARRWRMSQYINWLNSRRTDLGRSISNHHLEDITFS